MLSWSQRLTPTGDHTGLRRVLLGFFLLALVATAWVHDDAFISFRSVENLVEGRGLTWNDGERVQVFTHPLWFFIHAAAYAVTGDLYFTTLALCFLCTLLTLYLLAFRLPKTAFEGAVALAALLLSQGFVDYSTSGLENPLTHLLLALIAWLVWSRDDLADHSTPLALLTALALLNRLDLLPLLLPGLVLQLARSSAAQRVRALAALGLPLLAWGTFALVYFGSPAPNTAAAKLATGISPLGKAVQGLGYVGSNLVHDGFTLLFGCWLATLLWTRGGARARAVVLGVGLQMLYLIAIGGDYMSGRAFTAPFILLLLAVVHEGLLRTRPPRLKTWATIAMVSLALRGAATLAGHAVDPFGIGDERRVWHPHTGLLYAAVTTPWPEGRAWRYEPAEACDGRPCIRSQDIVGMVGFYSGPEVYLLDNMALGDAFRARLPGIRGGDFNRPGRLNWRPGHVERPYPEGLVESIRSGRNEIVDPDLAVFYEAIRLATNGPLWSRARWRAIWRLNTGAYVPGIRRWAQRHPELFAPRNERPPPEFGPPTDARQAPDGRASDGRLPPRS